MEALKNDLKVLLVGAIILLVLVFIIGLFKILLITGILILAYFLLRVMRSDSKKKEEPEKT